MSRCLRPTLDTLVGAGGWCGDRVVVGGDERAVPPTPRIRRSPLVLLVAWSGTDEVRAAWWLVDLHSCPGRRLVGPSVDRFGWVWGLPASSVSVGGEPMVRSASAVRAVPATFAVRISRLGTRAPSCEDPTRAHGWGRRTRGLRASAGDPCPRTDPARTRIRRRRVVDDETAHARRTRDRRDDQLVTLPLGGCPQRIPPDPRDIDECRWVSSAVVISNDASGSAGAHRSGALWQNAPGPHLRPIRGRAVAGGSRSGA